MGRARFFDHTADVGLDVAGVDLDDLFTTAAEALMDAIVVDRQAIVSEVREGVELDAADLTELLVAWLSEVIFRVETQHRVYSTCVARVEQVDALRWRMTGTLEGEPIDRARHVLDHEVKAVTRHGARVWEEDGEWRGELILDI